MTFKASFAMGQAGESRIAQWLLFLHEGGQGKDSPANSPAGLFGNKLDTLRHCESHRSPKWGKHGMVYWNHDTLLPMATLREMANTR